MPLFGPLLPVLPLPPLLLALPALPVFEFEMLDPAVDHSDCV